MLQRRTPMRSGFLRTRPDRRPPPPDREERRAKSIAALLASPGRRVEVGGTTSGKPIEKEDASQSAAYMRAAKALGYCMRCGRQVQPLSGELDFCHRDLGKGQGIKTDARLGWPGCRRCHEVVGRELPRAARRAVEILLGAMTRAAVLAAGTWPKRLPAWKEGSQCE